MITDQDPSPEQAARWSLRDPKDVPILAGAINSRCTFLVTADVACFGEHMRGPPFHGVRVLKPGVFLQHLGISKPNHNI